MEGTKPKKAENKAKATQQDMFQVVRRGLVFLLDEYLEAKYLQMQSQLDTNEAFKDNAAILESGKAQVVRLKAKIKRAEAILAGLKAKD